MRRPTEPSERLQRILAGTEPPPPASATPPAEAAPPVITVPPQLGTARWRVTPRAVLGAALVLAVAVIVLVLRTGAAERAARPVAVSSTGVVAKGDRAPFASGSPSAGSGGSSGTLYVHVVGRVRRPGVVPLPAGSRVADAVEAVGGTRSGADLEQVNLARPVIDGEQLVVPRAGEAAAAVAGAPAAGTAPGAGPAAPGPAGVGGQPGAAGAAVDLNSADQATLETLPGVGPVLAERIIEWRTTNGRFTTVEELNEVSGIGEKLYAQISPKVVV